MNWPIDQWKIVGWPNNMLYRCLQHHIPLSVGKYAFPICYFATWIAGFAFQGNIFSKESKNPMPCNICPKSKEIKCNEFKNRKKHWIFHALPWSALITAKYKLIQVIIFTYKPRHIKQNALIAMTKEWYMQESLLHHFFPTWLLFVQSHEK